ncbi:hypothetical protein Anas_05908 [Armadillidium nasatum]|uniref:Uncharacterized protein n=1 Tax=Armadillidium nasatum TaxID=96803 RepID=A0A5N5TPK3_9CRUS|nr:hypothetical protein Anas_05908 [Armadillidium nasatum]
MMFIIFQQSPEKSESNEVVLSQMKCSVSENLPPKSKTPCSQSGILPSSVVTLTTTSTCPINQSVSENSFSCKTTASNLYSKSVKSLEASSRVDSRDDLRKRVLISQGLRVQFLPSSTVEPIRSQNVQSTTKPGLNNALSDTTDELQRIGNEKCKEINNWYYGLSSLIVVVNIGVIVTH